ncbi:MAG: aryl-sulfate sulfotransferase [Rhodospirillaceae bacterium]|nr:aryl-sulfate sulfotransferase [Rhodospirillaceae bacterium]
MSKHSVKLAGHRTSVSIENEFWDALKVIAAKKGETITDLLTHIDRNRPGNLSSAVRLFVLRWYQTHR